MPAASAPAAADPTPLTVAEFAAVMTPLGPFGAAPRLAAGVSGGPDSLALALLAAAWARARGGDLLALIVDHGLRPESAAEATSVARLLAGQGIASRILPLTLPGGTGLQARARAARRAALLAACAEAGRPWLLLGHQRGDQAETLLLRAERGSGLDGLAGMAAASPAAEALVLRPMLGMPAARLAATVAAAGLRALADPSNRDRRFARTGLRLALAATPGAEARLAAASASFARHRAGAEAALVARLAACARILPEGWAVLDPQALGDDDLADRALGALLRAVGGAAYPLPGEAVAALRRRGRGTLGGAWLRPGRGGWQVLRAPGPLGPPVPAHHGAVWDGRFRLEGAGDPGCVIGPLGAAAADLPAYDLPAAVRVALPGLWREGMLAAAPLLDYPVGAKAGRGAMVFQAMGLASLPGRLA
jgi:tRNA(Ile)-lysidine synthase